MRRHDRFILGICTIPLQEDLQLHSSISTGTPRSAKIMLVQGRLPGKPYDVRSMNVVTLLPIRQCSLLLYIQTEFSMSTVQSRSPWDTSIAELLFGSRNDAKCEKLEWTGSAHIQHSYWPTWKRMQLGKPRSLLAPPGWSSCIWTHSAYQ